MSIKSVPLTESDSGPDEAVGPRKVSPEISEVLHLIGAMERLIDDVEQRRNAAAAPAGD